jgi:hypothetical protein
MSPTPRRRRFSRRLSSDWPIDGVPDGHEIGDAPCWKDWRARSAKRFCLEARGRVFESGRVKRDISERARRA